MTQPNRRPANASLVSNYAPISAAGAPLRSLVLRTGLRAFVAAVLVALVSVVGISAAQAHDELIGSNPKEGSTVATAPKEMVLTYSAEIKQIGAAIILEKSDGTKESLNPKVTREELVVQLPKQPDGKTVLKWRVVSSDGHPIEGAVTYTVGSGKNSGTNNSAAPSTGSSQGSQNPANEDTQSPAASSERSEENSSLPWWSWAIIGAVIFGGGYFAWSYFGRKDTTSTPEHSGSEGKTDE